MDQPTAEQALHELDPLVGEWTVEATWPNGERWPGGGRVTFEWHDSGAHLVQRGTVDLPEAPDNVSIIGCDAANGTYIQLYSDERGVSRIYRMSIGNGVWTLWARGRTVRPAIHGHVQRRRRHDHRPLGDRRGRLDLRDRLRPHLPSGHLSARGDSIHEQQRNPGREPSAPAARDARTPGRRLGQLPGAHLRRGVRRNCGLIRPVAGGEGLHRHDPR